MARPRPATKLVSLLSVCRPYIVQASITPTGATQFSPVASLQEELPRAPSPAVVVSQHWMTASIPAANPHGVRRWSVLIRWPLRLWPKQARASCPAHSNAVRVDKHVCLYAGRPIDQPSFVNGRPIPCY